MNKQLRPLRGGLPQGSAITICSSALRLALADAFRRRSGLRSRLAQVEPVLAASANEITFKHVAYARTARILCDGMVYIKNERPAQYAAWKEVDEITAASFYLEGDSVSIQA